ncbi:MAG: 2-oxoacid:acceptor oxidoreductase family protein [Deltaproteobacteria bacterium]|nr:2-oxoacid:acceptor oxidoreductase family protein [Deltaproteobacteria bacterium]
MYRVRFHGRGGQGIKTASRILGSAFFAEGFEVQDAPRYGAERRGAPIFATVRADRAPVTERGPIDRPDLVIVTDESLTQVPAAGVMSGLCDTTVLVISSDEPPDVWRERLGVSGVVLSLSPDPEENAALMGAASVGVAARLVGVISQASLEAAIRTELADLAPQLIERNLERARETFSSYAALAGCVAEGDAQAAAPTAPPNWVELEAEPTLLATPDISGSVTSELVPTGLWRTMRPVIDESLCNRCSWICSTLCPDGAIHVDAERRPIIDYDHCKGCLLCVAVCPPHAIRVEPEATAVDPGRKP